MERDSLSARARTSSRCKRQWSAATAQANSVVSLLHAGRDRGATQAALRVGSKWKAAADCEGWPTPKQLGNPARKGEVNYHMFDRYTVAHFATGIGLGVMRLNWWQAAIFAIGWELIETPLKRAIPRAFPYSSEDTLANATGDALGMMAGWAIWQLIVKGSSNANSIQG